MSVGRLRDEVTLVLNRQEARRVFEALHVARYRLQQFADTARVTGREDSYLDRLTADEASLAAIHARLEEAMIE